MRCANCGLILSGPDMLIGMRGPTLPLLLGELYTDAEYSVFGDREWYDGSIDCLALRNVFAGEKFLNGDLRGDLIGEQKYDRGDEE